MEHRVAAWESMPWEAGGRGGCRAWRKDGRHIAVLLRLGRCNPAKKDPPPLSSNLAPLPVPSPYTNPWETPEVVLLLMRAHFLSGQT